MLTNLRRFTSIYVNLSKSCRCVQLGLVRDFATKRNKKRLDLPPVWLDVGEFVIVFISLQRTEQSEWRLCGERSEDTRLFQIAFGCRCRTKAEFENSSVSTSLRCDRLASIVHREIQSHWEWRMVARCECHGGRSSSFATKCRLEIDILRFVRWWCEDSSSSRCWRVRERGNICGRKWTHSTGRCHRYHRCAWSNEEGWIVYHSVKCEWARNGFRSMILIWNLPISD